MKREKIVIGTRGSKLALIYAERVKDKISEQYKNKIETKTIITLGDRNQKDRLSEIGGKGFYSKTI